MNPPQYLEISTPLYQKCMNPAGRKISKAIAEIISVINYPDKNDPSRLLHPTVELTFFSSSNVTFTSIDKTTACNPQTNKYEAIEII